MWQQERKVHGSAVGFDVVGDSAFGVTGATLRWVWVRLRLDLDLDLDLVCLRGSEWDLCALEG